MASRLRAKKIDRPYRRFHSSGPRNLDDTCICGMTSCHRSAPVSAADKSAIFTEHAMPGHSLCIIARWSTKFGCSKAHLTACMHCRIWLAAAAARISRTGSRSIGPGPSGSRPQNSFRPPAVHTQNTLTSLTNIEIIINNHQHPTPLQEVSTLTNRTGWG